MLRRTRRPAADTVRFCDACAQGSTTDGRAGRRYADQRHLTLLSQGVLR